MFKFNYMKKVGFLLVSAVLTLSLNSCTKDCYECHYYDANDNEVEIGEKCDDDLEKLEAEGYTLNGVTYEAHCGEH